MNFKSKIFKYTCFIVAITLLLMFWTFFVWRHEITVWLVDLSRMLEDMAAYLKDMLRVLDGVPLICYSLVILVLPILFLPVTPIYIIAASRAAEDSYLVVLLYCYLGLTLNIVFSYYISRYFGKYLRAFFNKRNIRIPEIPENEQYELTFLIRMIPGNPLTVQNYLLGMANIPFFKYVVISLPIQYIQVAIYVWFGEAIFDGGMSKILLGGSLLFVVGVIARMLSKRYGHKLKASKKEEHELPEK